MICNNNFADILRVCEIKDLIWVMRFQCPLVYLKSSRLSLILDETIPFVMYKSKSKIAASVSKEFALFN